MRMYSNDGQPGKMSKEGCVFPRNSKSRSFSARRDSSSAVIDGISRVCGIIAGGDGARDVSDSTFVTSISFFARALEVVCIEANVFLLAADLSDQTPFLFPCIPMATRPLLYAASFLSNLFCFYSFTTDIVLLFDMR